MLWFTLLAAVGASSEFDKFRAEAPLVGKPAPVSMHLRDARMYRTMLRAAAAEGPNFNGHYRVTKWGNGTGAATWSVIDLSTGAVWFAADAGLGTCPGSDITDNGLEYLEHRLDSSLLYVHTCTDKYPIKYYFNTRRVYAWRSGAAKLLREESIK